MSAPLVTIGLDTEIGGWRLDPDSGESYGHGTTVADAIVHHAAKMLVEQLKPEVAKVVIAAADEQELRPDDGDRYGQKKKPVITVIIEREVKEALTTELAAVVKAARDKVVGAVRDQAAEMIADAVKGGLR